MRNLSSMLLDVDEPQPLSPNRRMEFMLRMSTLDVAQLSMLAAIPVTRLEFYFVGRVDLLSDELSRLACVLRDTIRANNQRLERLLSGRRPRKIRKARSAGATAASLAKARSVRAARLKAVAGAQ